MAVMTFAAIDIGSYEVSMKIFEMSKRIGFRELNDVRYSLEIGKGVYSDGKIDSEMLNVLCEVLNDFKRLMQGLWGGRVSCLRHQCIQRTCESAADH